MLTRRRIALGTVAATAAIALRDRPADPDDRRPRERRLGGQGLRPLHAVRAAAARARASSRTSRRTRAHSRSSSRTRPGSRTHAARPNHDDRARRRPKRSHPRTPPRCPRRPRPRRASRCRSRRARSPSGPACDTHVRVRRRPGSYDAVTQPVDALIVVSALDGVSHGNAYIIRWRSPSMPVVGGAGRPNRAAPPAYAHRKLAMHDHAHTHVHTDDARRLTIALALILGLMAGEVVAGLLADSLALLSDAAHMLTDAGAIALALFAARLARPAGRGRVHVRVPARRDPVRPAQRGDARRARRSSSRSRPCAG